MAALSGRLNTLKNKHNTDIRVEDAATNCSSCDMAAGDAFSTFCSVLLGARVNQLAGTCSLTWLQSSTLIRPSAIN